MAQISKALVAAAKRITSLPKRAGKAAGVAEPTSKAVSYTHLTLPTIYSV